MSLFSFIHDGLRPQWIQVEFHSRFQIPSFSILGLPSQEIQEAKERVVAAFHASGIEFPKKRILINLAPASLRKWGTGHDLAIAAAVFASLQDRPNERTVLGWGELGLDGEIKPMGQMPALAELLCQNPESLPLQAVYLHPQDAERLSWLLQWRANHRLPVSKSVEIHPVRNLTELADAMTNGTSTQILSFGAKASDFTPKMPSPELLPLPDALSRPILAAVAGHHHLMLLGPRGIGKSRALEWLKVLTGDPKPSDQWLRWVQSEPQELSDWTPQVPIRQVHAQVKPAHLLGGFRSHRYIAGELARSHGGILIADEFLEWPRDAKECLREPLENQHYTLIRAGGRTEVPCKIQLVGSANLCPCGGDPHDSKSGLCRCRPNEVEHYLKKLSGPIADRIDLLARLSSATLSETPHSTLETLKTKVHRAQESALRRWGQLPGEWSPSWIESHLRSEIASQPSVQSILDRVPSLRSRHKVIRIAHTLASLDDTGRPQLSHYLEASAYRPEWSSAP